MQGLERLYGSQFVHKIVIRIRSHRKLNNVFLRSSKPSLSLLNHLSVTKVSYSDDGIPLAHIYVESDHSMQRWTGILNNFFDYDQRRFYVVESLLE